MLIGIDGNEANLDKRVGVNTYAFELLKGLYQLRKNDYSDVDFEIFLKGQPKSFLPKERSFWKYKILPASRLWIVTKLTPYLLKDGKIDIFFTPSHYLPPIVKIPSACSIMDVGYLESKGQFTTYDFWQLKLWTARSLKIAQKVFSISEATKSDVVSHYPAVKNKTVVTLLGYDQARFNTKISTSATEKAKKKYKTGDKYVLFLGTLKPNKNIEGLLKAWKKISPKNKEAKLIIGGRKGWLFQSIFETAEKEGILDSVVFTGFVNEDLKPGLMAGSRLFVLPSFWEGFGLDVLSSMACGVPVVTSKKGSLPEVAGEAALYADPHDSSDIGKQIDKVLNMSPKEYNSLKVKSIKQAAKFTWQKTAQQTLEELISLKK